MAALLARAGVHLSHTHMNELEQMNLGLYGPLIVLEPGADGILIASTLSSSAPMASVGHPRLHQRRCRLRHCNQGWHRSPAPIDQHPRRLPDPVRAPARREVVPLASSGKDGADCLPPWPSRGQPDYHWPRWTEGCRSGRRAGRVGARVSAVRGSGVGGEMRVVVGRRRRRETGDGRREKGEKGEGRRGRREKRKVALV